MKSVEQKDEERKARIAAAEAKDQALKGEKAMNKKKSKAAAAEAEAETEKPKRGRGRQESGPAAPARKRTRTGVKTG